MLKPVEPVGVSDYQRPPHDGRQSLEELVAVPAHPQVLVHPDRLPVPAVHAVAQQPQADGEPLAVRPQALRAGLLVDVVQRELRVAGAVVQYPSCSSILVSTSLRTRRMSPACGCVSSSPSRTR